jgi:hypothetical protein
LPSDRQHLVIKDIIWIKTKINNIYYI